MDLPGAAVAPRLSWMEVARQYRDTEMWALASSRMRIQRSQYYQEDRRGADRVMGLALQLISVPVQHLAAYVAAIDDGIDYLMDHWYRYRPGARNNGLAGELVEHDEDIFRDMCMAFQPYSKEVSAFCALAANIVMNLCPERRNGLSNVFTDYGWPSPIALLTPEPEVTPPSDQDLEIWLAIPETLPQDEIDDIDYSDELVPGG